MKYKVRLTRDYKNSCTYHLWIGGKPDWANTSTILSAQWLHPKHNDEIEAVEICTDNVRGCFPLKRHMKGGPKSIKCYEITVKEIKK